LGEIDIVARRGGVIVFVEVRTRRADALVDPMESIDDLKLAHLVDAARHYLGARRITETRCRFDIISVRPGVPVRDRVRHCADAFRITDERPARGARLRSWIRRRPRP
jgi:putative endonuclease